MKYTRLAETYQELESTQKTLEKTDILADLFREGEDELPELVLLSLGRPFPSWNDYEIGISGRTMADIIQQATGRSETEVEELWKEQGDLGKVAEELVKKKTQRKLVQEELTVEKVIQRIRKICNMEKEGMSQSVSMDKKKSEVADLISSAEPLEARYVTRTVLQTLRVGVAEGTVRDALAEAFFEGEHAKDIQRAYDFTNDFAEVAEACREGIKTVKNLDMKLFRPINLMLAKKVETVEKGFETVGKPAAIEYKYDGMRAQIHVDGDEVRVFTRRLEDVTEQFPDVKNAVKEHIDEGALVIDAEIVGYDPEDGSTIPFQKLSKRIKRKYEIQKMKREIPVEVRPFDLIYENEPLLEKPYSERWERLDQLVDEEEQSLRLVDHYRTDEEEEVHRLQQESLDAGHEGIMMKSLDRGYKPGSRVGYMVKLKPVMETLDLAIIGGEWSEGRRTGWIGSLTLGCYNPEEDEYLEVGKMATGLTDKQLQEITDRLEPLIIEEDGRDVSVRPEVIVEAEYEEIQESPKYSSGYALRFPRLKQFRDDKEDADSIEKIKNLYGKQK